MGCEGKVSFAMLMAKTIGMRLKDKVLLLELFRMAESLGSAKLTSTLEFLSIQTTLTEKEVRLALKRLQKDGWVNRGRADKRADKRAETTILKFATFLTTRADERADERADDVVSSSLGVPGVTQGVDVLPVVNTLKVNNAVPKSAPPIPSETRPKKSKPKVPENAEELVPGFARLQSHIEASWSKKKYGNRYVWKGGERLALFTICPQRGGAHNIAGLWDRMLAREDAFDLKMGYSIHHFVSQIDGLLHDGYKKAGEKYRERWANPALEAADQIQIVAQVAANGIEGVLSASGAASRTRKLTDAELRAEIHNRKAAKAAPTPRRTSTYVENIPEGWQPPDTDDLANFRTLGGKLPRKAPVASA